MARLELVSNYFRQVDLLEEGVSPLEPGVVGVAGQSVVQGALSPGQEVGGALGEDLDSQGHDFLQVNSISAHPDSGIAGYSSKKS